MRESDGIISAPKSSSAIVCSGDEITICLEIYQDIIHLSDIAIDANDYLELNRSYSRLLHVVTRMERVQPISQDEVVSISEILDCVYIAIHRVTGIINAGKSRNKRNTIQPVQITSDVPVHSDQTISRVPTQLVQSTSALPLNTRSGNAGAVSSHNSTQVQSLSPAGAEGGSDDPNLNARESLCDISLLREDERANILSENGIFANLRLDENNSLTNRSTGIPQQSPRPS